MFPWTLIFLLLFVAVPVSFADDIGELIACVEGIDGANKRMNRKLSGGFAGTNHEPGQCDLKKFVEIQTEKYQLDGRGNEVEMTVLTEQEANRLYQEIVRPKSRDMKLRNYGVCPQRALMIGQGFHLKGIKTGKFFIAPRIFGVGTNSKAAEPFLSSQNLHVVNVILVRDKEGMAKPWVIDPFLYPEGPVPKTEYEKVMPSSVRQPYFLTNEYIYKENFRLTERTQYNQSELAEARSILENAYSSTRPDAYFMSVERRERYLEERAAEINASRSR